MSEAGNEATVREVYRELLPDEDTRPAADQARRVVNRARAQLAVRDMIGLAFGGVVRVVLALVVAISRHAHRRRSARTAATPTNETGANHDA